MTDSTFLHAVQRELVWVPAIGMGYYPVDPATEPYDALYFEKYRGYAETELGAKITWERLELVERQVGNLATVLDIGIGCGDFIAKRRARGGIATYGYDVSRAAIMWLESRGLFQDSATFEPDVLTFWDSLEHLEDPAATVSRARTWVFVSLPIFEDAEHVLRSKHLRPTEHRWYWTRDGLIRWFDTLGFQCVEHGTLESLLGREDVHTFAFRRLEHGES